jgi:hypothetical protein
MRGTAARSARNPSADHRTVIGRRRGVEAVVKGRENPVWRRRSIDWSCANGGTDESQRAEQNGREAKESRTKATRRHDDRGDG